MSLPKLLIYLAVWRRPEITEVCFMGIDRLRRSGLFPIKALAVISEESMKPLCKKYDIDFCFYKNDPLGEKKNYGLSVAMETPGWDYLIEIGSDDVLKTGILEVYRPFLSKSFSSDSLASDVFGISSAYYLNSENGECREYKTATAFGMGRCISREALEKCAAGVEVIAKDNLVAGARSVVKDKKGFFPVEDAKDLERVGHVRIVGQPTYKLWPDDINMSMDNSSTYFMLSQGFKHKRVHTGEPMGIDIKSSENIWPYNPDIGDHATIDKVLRGLSDQEQKAIFAIIKKNHANKIETSVIR